MRRFALLLVLVFLTLTASAIDQPMQWLPYDFGSYSSAVAWAAQGATDAKPPQIITTGDALVPFVVYRYQPAPRWWCCLLAHFRGQVLRTETALVRYRGWRSATYRKVGLLTMPDGTAIVWMTY